MVCEKIVVQRFVNSHITCIFFILVKLTLLQDKAIETFFFDLISYNINAAGNTIHKLCSYVPYEKQFICPNLEFSITL